MSDGTTQATREDWQSHAQEVKEAMIAAQMALVKIENHVGRPLAASVQGLNRQVSNLTARVESALLRLSERQKLVKKPL